MLIKTKQKDFNHFKSNMTNTNIDGKTTGDIKNASLLLHIISVHIRIYIYKHFRNCIMSCTFQTALRGRIMNYLCGCAVAYKTLTTLT